MTHAGAPRQAAAPAEVTPALVGAAADTAAAGDIVASTPERVAGRLAELAARLDAAGQAIGFPAATLIDWEPLGTLFTSGLINNLGDPDTIGLYPRHAKDFETELIETLADLLRAPAGDRWGYVTGEASEGILWAMRLARRTLPANPLVMHSRAAHPAIPDAADTLGLTSIVLAADGRGELDYTDLEAQVAAHRDRPLIVAATAGTTWSEAVDDVRRIIAVLDRQQIPASRRFVLVDAAFAGIPLALLDPNDRPGFDLADGADAVVISGQKFPGTPMPCAVVLTRRTLIPDTGPISYTGGRHTTLSFSRNGHAVVAFWYAVHVLGADRLAEIAAGARDVARYLHTRLAGIGWQAWRNPHAMTVTLDAPPEHLRARHRLVVVDGRSHIVCAPGITRATVDTLIAELTGTPASAPVVTPDQHNGNHDTVMAAPVEATGNGVVAAGLGLLRARRRTGQDEAAS